MYIDPVIKWMTANGVELTRENYLAANNLDEPDGPEWQWPPELAEPDTAADKRKAHRQQIRSAIAWRKAVEIIDASENAVRDIIERDLAGPAGFTHVRYFSVAKLSQDVMKKIEKVRANAFKRAFKQLRDAL